jgi:hypothetical protein
MSWLIGIRQYPSGPIVVHQNLIGSELAKAGFVFVISQSKIEEMQVYCQSQN